MPADSAETPPEELPSAPATRTRLIVLGVMCLLAGVLYLDRVCISQALPAIREEMALSKTEGSYVLMAFTLAYALFEVPTGRWGDRLGARRIITRIAVWWSAFTALTGVCTGLSSLLIVRFLFGAGEAGAFPNVARVMSRWFPDDERGRAQGIVLAASSIGGAVSPILAEYLIQKMGWRWTFAVFGAVGVVWAVGFWWWFRDDPAEHPQVNAAEVARIGRRAASGQVHAPIPWPLVLRNPSVWMLSLIMTFASFNSYIYFSWFPTYLQEGRGVDSKTASVMAAVVLGLSACGLLVGGWIMDRFVTGRGNLPRRVFGCAAYLLAAGLIALALYVPQAWPAVILTALSSMMTQSTLSLWWSCTIGISGRHVGALFGLMNSAGVFGALISQYIPGRIADLLEARGYSGRSQWDPIFQVDIVVLILAAIVWAALRFRTVEPEAASSE